MKKKRAKEIARILAAGPAFVNCYVVDEKGNRALYTASLKPCADESDLRREVVLTPVTNGSDARTRSLIEYAYTHGGSMFCAAVDTARMIELYITDDELMFPHS